MIFQYIILNMEREYTLETNILPSRGEYMCQMSIILEKNGTEEIILESASTLEVTEKGIEVGTLFDPPRTVKNVKVKKIDFLGGKVTLVSEKEDIEI